MAWEPPRRIGKDLRPTKLPDGPHKMGRLLSDEPNLNFPPRIAAIAVREKSLPWPFSPLDNIRKRRGFSGLPIAAPERRQTMPSVCYGRFHEVWLRRFSWPTNPYSQESLEDIYKYSPTWKIVGDHPYGLSTRFRCTAISSAQRGENCCKSVLTTMGSRA